MHLERFIPGPERFFKPAGNVVAAAAFGASYGLIGRVLYPKDAIYPVEYALWFTVAFQIKSVILMCEDQCEQFLGVGTYFSKWDKPPSEPVTWRDHIRSRCWKIVVVRNTVVKKIDAIFSGILNLRPYQEITAANVYDASFLEMCRYRIWSVFKSTLVATFTSFLARQLLVHVGYTFPFITTVNYYIAASAILQDIIFIPSLCLYLRVWDPLGEKSGEGVGGEKRQVSWVRQYLPAL